jgi:triphosphoribosyl-dephospho-CoA synthase
MYPQRKVKTKQNKPELQNCSSTRTSTARTIGHFALQSLYLELSAYPKPGLVSPIDSGSHRDMDASLFFRSLFSLRRYFCDIAEAGMRGESFATLKSLGLIAEKRMFKATCGINTHRGAIFNLGLLAAAAGHFQAHESSQPTSPLGALVCSLWGDAIRKHGESLPQESHGRLMTSRYGVGGALQEAMYGFPHVFKVGLPALQRSLDKGADQNSATVQCLFSLIEVVPDTNLLYRGGECGLNYAQKAARSFLDEGGVHRPEWQAHAVDVHQNFIRKNLSPGGSADLLAASLFVHRLMVSHASIIKTRSASFNPAIGLRQGDQ